MNQRLPSREKGHLISPALRKAEKEIDRVYLGNGLTKRPFTEAVWCFLSCVETQSVRPIIDPASSSLSGHDLNIWINGLVNSCKWPMRWLWKTCGRGGHPPPRYDDSTYREAIQLLDLATRYTPFETAYTYASNAAIQLSFDDNKTIIPDSVLRSDAQYEMYDRFANYRKPPTMSPERRDAMDELIQRVSHSVRCKGVRFGYRLGSKTIELAISSLDTPLGPPPHLPDDWRFSRYTMGDFQIWAKVLRSICQLHVFARVAACRMGLPEYGYADGLLIKNKRDLCRLFVRYAGLSYEIVEALVEDCTYGSRCVRPNLLDPVLQPLFRISPNKYLIAPNLVIFSSLERNFSVLMNRIPEERSLYSKLSQDRENLSRSRIVKGISSLCIRSWWGRMPGWGEAREIDLALMERPSKCCLILELKSFVAPDEVREILNRSKEIDKGIEQIRRRRHLAVQEPHSLFETLGIDQTWNVSWAVASESSVGAGFVQSDDVPVVRIGHLIRKIVDSGGLQGIGTWLRNRDYLPVEGKHYKITDEEISVGQWTLRWHDMQSLIDEDYI